MIYKRRFKKALSNHHIYDVCKVFNQIGLNYLHSYSIVEVRVKILFVAYLIRRYIYIYNINLISYGLEARNKPPASNKIININKECLLIIRTK